MEKKKLAFVGNSLKTMCNFRLGVMSALVREGYDVTVIAPKDGDISAVRSNRIHFKEVDIDCKGMNPMTDLKLIIHLRRIYRQEHYDVIFHYTIKPVIYGSIAARHASTPQISVITGLGYTFIQKGWIHRLAKCMYRFSLRSANEVWFLNQEDKTLFLEQELVSVTKTRLLNGEGVNTEQFKPSATRLVHPFTFLFVGRILWDKGVGEYVEAAQEVKRQHSMVQFKILGPLGANNPASISSAQMQEWEKKGTIKYLGETNNVIPYVSSADCIVLPSYREGLSRVLLEAASMQKPIIATNVPGCRDIVVNGETGFLCEPRNTSSLIACMMHMLSLSEEELEQFGVNSRQLIEKKFDEKLIIQIYKERLEDLLPECS